MSKESFPMAETKSQPALRSLAIGGISRMWIATIVCLLIAIGLTWYSLGESGTEIVLRFQQGHGLKPGDPVRDRGIEIGTVTSVQLNRELTGIEVRAELNPAAEAVAREGSRFWIVRPTLDITGISGIETAVGSKYIAVSPGPIASPVRQLDFVGLESAPVDELGQGGLELILRGQQRFGVNPGSPVTWRGIEVGKILSSTLSADSMHVDIRIRINATHRRLVARNSKFWVISGIHFDAGVTGFEFSAESLVTIIRGGIAFITPKPFASQPVEAGDVFTLHEKEDEEWTAKAAAINLLELHPPPMVSLTARWDEKLLGFTRSKQRRAVGVVVKRNGGAGVIVPTDFVTAPEDALENTFVVQVDGDAGGKSQRIAVGPAAKEQLLSEIALTGSHGGASAKDRFRVPTEPEDCFVVRRRTGDTGAEVVVEAIGRHEIVIDGDRWRSTKAGLSGDVWHGAPVLSAEDEKIIGILLISDDHAHIVPSGQ